MTSEAFVLMISFVPQMCAL